MVHVGRGEVVGEEGASADERTRISGLMSWINLSGLSDYTFD
jgi:hypothetical protein